MKKFLLLSAMLVAGCGLPTGEKSQGVVIGADAAPAEPQPDPTKCQYWETTGCKWVTTYGGGFCTTDTYKWTVCSHTPTGSEPNNPCGNHTHASKTCNSDAKSASECTLKDTENGCLDKVRPIEEWEQLTGYDLLSYCVANPRACGIGRSRK